MIRQLVQRIFSPAVDRQVPLGQAPGAVPTPQDVASVTGAYQLRSPGGGTFALPSNGQPVTIGRLPGSDVRLGFGEVSRTHATLQIADGVIQIRDEGSTKGTVVNGVPLNPHQWYGVLPGSEISFAGHVWTLEPQTGVPAVPRGVGIDGAVHVAGAAVGGPPGVALPVALGALKLVGTDGNAFALRTNGVTRLGRSGDAHIHLVDPAVSGSHAQFAVVDGHLLMQNTSRYGSTVNGSPLARNLWYPMLEDAAIHVGHQDLKMARDLPQSPGAARTLPDGRLAFIQNLPDGKLRVSKVEFTMPLADLKPEDLRDAQDGKQKFTTAQQMRVGQELFLPRGGRLYNANFLGTDGHDQLRFGHIDDYTPEAFAHYEQEQQKEVERQREADAARARKRGAGAVQLQAQEWPRVGYSPASTESADRVASRIIHLNGKLAHDGHSIYPPPIEDAVVRQVRDRMTADPQIGGKGLTGLRLNRWLAEHRGEMPLVRGLKGAYNDKSPGLFFTSDVGCALGQYTKNKTGEGGSVIALRIPISDYAQYYMEVGMVPGRNPYADVVAIPPDALHNYPAPELVIDSAHPEHQWMFDRARANGAIEDKRAGQEDYLRLCGEITGKLML